MTPVETALREERYRVEMRATSRSRIGHLPECRKWQPVGDLEHLSREDAEGHMRGFVERDKLRTMTRLLPVLLLLCVGCWGCYDHCIQDPMAMFPRCWNDPKLDAGRVEVCPGEAK